MRILKCCNRVYYYFYERSREVILNARGGGKALSTLESMLIGLIAGDVSWFLAMQFIHFQRVRNYDYE